MGISGLALHGADPSGVVGAIRGSLHALKQIRQRLIKGIDPDQA
jgi:hypothetical protein